MIPLSTVRFPSGRVVHARFITRAFGPRTLCGRYGDPRGGDYDLTPGAEARTTCVRCRLALAWLENLHRAEAAS